MATTDNGGSGRYESAALWIAAILMMVAIALYAWLAGGGPARSAPPMVMAGNVHAEPTTAAAPGAAPSIAPAALEEEPPAEPVPTF